MSVNPPVFADSLTSNKNQSGDKELNAIQLYLTTQGKNKLIRVEGTILDIPVIILIDNGSSHNLILTQFVDRYSLQDLFIKNKGTIELGNGSVDDSSYYACFPYIIQEFTDNAIFYLTKLSDKNDMILEQEWLFDQKL